MSHPLHTSLDSAPEFSTAPEFDIKPFPAPVSSPNSPSVPISALCEISEFAPVKDIPESNPVMALIPESRSATPEPSAKMSPVIVAGPKVKATEANPI
ncbi:hypothetical protein DPX16_8173 [Anabarilius grahami]|uniref:Uncharacterized protein n=1 Tax=Anabarilius grahami TaxID=495550 RepID=A0A3N0YUX5_ANAGA|nr:hypothetical protein DPX16_8173 [Anabarilius grahami]